MGEDADAPSGTGWLPMMGATRPPPPLRFVPGASSPNLHIYPSSFRFESRILKQTRAIVDAEIAEEVHIISVWEDGLPELEEIDSARRVWRVRRPEVRLLGRLLGRLVGTVVFSWKVLLTYRRVHPSHIHAHSLSVLPLAAILKVLRGGRLVYDTHELESLRTGLGRLTRFVARTLEHLLMPLVDVTFVVSPSIADWYRNKYPRTPVHVVRNIPLRSDISGLVAADLRGRFGLAEEDLLFLYQGLLGHGRGLEELFDAFADVGGQRHLIVMGYGLLEAKARRAAQDHVNIHFHPAVPPTELLRHTLGADVGLAYIQPISTSYRYCLPNKLFEYLACGIPVLVSDLPDMGALVDEFGCGWRVPLSPTALAEQLAAIDWEALREKAAAADRAAAALLWEDEARTYTENLMPVRPEARA